MDSLEFIELKEGWRMAVEFNFAFDYDTSQVWLPIRDRLHDAQALDKEIMEIDRQAIIRAVREGSDRPYRRDYEELTRWWWHLEKIASEEYPAQLLPEYLRETYLKALKVE